MVKGILKSKGKVIKNLDFLSLKVKRILYNHIKLYYLGEVMEHKTLILKEDIYNYLN